MADEFFRKNCRCNYSIFSHFSARPRGNKNAATIPSAAADGPGGVDKDR